MPKSNKDNSKVVIAVDYDNTITEYRPFPIKAPISYQAYIYLLKLHDKGYTLVLNTARKEPYYSEAVDELKKAGLYWIFSKEYEQGAKGKIQADFYIDDRAQINKFSWRKTYKYIVKHVKENSK